MNPLPPGLDPAPPGQIPGIGPAGDALGAAAALHWYGEAAAILEVVQQRPGCNLEQAQFRSGVSRRRFEPALRHLVEARCVAIHANGQTKHVLPYVPGIRGSACQVLLLLKPGVPDLHAWHFQQGPCTRVELLEHAAALGWSDRLTRDRLAQLLACHLMRRIAAPVGEDQRVTWFEAVDAREPAKLVLAGWAGHERFKLWLQQLRPRHRHP